MKFQLISSPNPALSVTEQVLANRGIAPQDAQHYLNTTDNDVSSPLLFGLDNLKKAAAAVVKCVMSGQRMLVLVDADTDGYTSAAIFINYLHDLFPTYVEEGLDWFLHSGKQHGLSDLETDIHYGVIVVPDAGSNDVALHEEYAAAGTTIVVLDHHEAELVPTPAHIINNQMCDYPNKFLSGAGVTWQFCRYLDFLLDNQYANKYLDLVALGLVADMMSLRSLETRHLVTQGLKAENLRNPFICGMVEKNAFTLGGKLTATGAAWYIAPFINAMVRSGEQQEKEILFQSMLDFKAHQIVSSTKRGHKLGETEELITQALRIVTNVKNRQTRVEESTLEELETLVLSQNLLNHKVLLFLLKPGQVDLNVAGLVANRLMAKYQRPCCVLTRVEAEDGVYFQGSARGCDLAGITEFKDICEGTGVINYALGHQGAFGLSIAENQIPAFISATDAALKDMPNEAIYHVDYIYENNNVSSQDVLDIAFLNEIWGKDLEEPYVALNELKVYKKMVAVYEKRDLTLKITLSSGVALIMFHAPEELCHKLKNQDDYGYCVMNIVATCTANEYGGKISPQLKIKDWELLGQSKWEF